MIGFGVACLALGGIMGYFLGSMNNSVMEISVSKNDNGDNLRRSLAVLDPKTVEPRVAQTLEPPPEQQSAVENNVREVHVGTMCRCPGGLLGIPGYWKEDGVQTNIVQPPSKATGPVAKKFIHHMPLGPHRGCNCVKSKYAEPSGDVCLGPLKERCPSEDNPYTPRLNWDDMPDLGVEQKLPLFLGVLSYKSPLSLNATLHDWRSHRFFERVGAADVFVQLNKMSDMDAEVVETHSNQLREEGLPPLNPMGGPSDNLHPGLAIGKFCRAAEEHPLGHPNGENLLLFLEKDWHLYPNGPKGKLANLEDIFHSINALVQRGVHYIRLQPPKDFTPERKIWNCPALGVQWLCTTSHQHKWTNLPAVIDCKWFLRYMEPYAMLEDPVMYGCRPGQMRNRYTDWEHALSDGRVAWTESNWVVAHFAPPRMKLWDHTEVDH